MMMTWVLPASIPTALALNLENTQKVLPLTVRDAATQAVPVKLLEDGVLGGCDIDLVAAVGKLEPLPPIELLAIERP